MAARRATHALLISLLVATGVLGVGPAAARADTDPVAERASITYRLDRARGRVTAKGTFRFTNRIPVQRVGNRVRRTYLDRWGPIAISADARGLRIRPRSVRIQRIPTGGPFDNLVFSFPRIHNGDSVSFTLSWHVPGRGTTSGTVVTDAYSRFCWTGQPVDSGPITLVVPRDLEVVTQGSAVRTSRKGRERHLTARGADLATFYACTDVYDPSLLVRRDLVSPLGHAVRVEGLPGHDAWLEATSRSISEALAGVEGVVGAPFPGDDPIKVRQVPSVALQGYAGDFDPRSGVIRLGDEGASVALLSHELSHAWFNAASLADNWLWEGFAEWAARETIGAPCDRPVEQPFGNRPQLGEWKVLQGGAASFEDQQVVQWQYLAACAIQGQVAAAIGPERMRRVIALLLSGDSPYDLVDDGTDDPAPGASGAPGTESPGPASPAPPRVPPGGSRPDPTAVGSPGSASATPSTTGDADGFSDTRSSSHRTRPVDWRQWLDIVDEVGLVPAGVTDLTFAEDLLVATGVIRRRAVRARADARAAFHELRALAPGGISPAVVRRGLDRWEFDDASRDMRLATRIATSLAALPATPDRAALWSEYERARSRVALERLRDRLP